MIIEEIVERGDTSDKTHVQSKQVYSNQLFAAKNGKKKPIVRKTDDNQHKIRIVYTSRKNN